MSTITHLTAFLVAVALSSSSVVPPPAATGEKNFELLILHNNDMHARFEQTSQLSGTCTPIDRDAGKCYGGFPRVAYVVKQAREAAARGDGPPVLYLNAGDTYTGTAWFTIYKWKIAAEFVNALKPDAVSLGNHELDDGVAGLTPFIRNLSSPVLAANLILDDVLDLQNVSNLYKSIIIQIDDTKIGIIGYLTPETKILAKKNNVEYEDEIPAISREVELLKTQGVNILIALGHSGYSKDIEIAKNVNDIDLVIGGHSHTFLGKPIQEEPEISQGPYPTIVTQQSGRNVLVVQAYAFTKYMGKLNLIFNPEGEIVKYDGMPILLSDEIPNDTEVLNIVRQYRKEIDDTNNFVWGQSLVPLNGNCRLEECNMGNLIADAILEYTARNFPMYSSAKIAIIQGGAIRTSITHTEIPINITTGDLITVLPFAATLTIVTMNGTTLQKVLEHSISKWNRVDSWGLFIQMAGMKVTYDLAQPIGSRVVEAQAVCSACEEQGLANITDQHEYKIIMPTFLAKGGDGYAMFESLPQELVEYNELICVEDYINKHSPVKPEETGRIMVHNDVQIVSGPWTTNKCHKLCVMFSLQVVTLVFILFS